MKNYAVILISFFAALVLTIFPFPEIINPARPVWVAMTLIFWVLAAPAHAGILMGFCIGLLLDILDGHLLGQSALALSLLAYLCLILYQRLRLYSPLQQSLMVFLLVGLYQLIHYWAESIVLGQGQIVLLMPAIGSALVWPLWNGILTWIRHYFRVQ